MKAVLDPALAALATKETAGGTLPLAVKRFREHQGAATAILAMQEAAAELLVDYQKRMPAARRRISAGELCKTCGVVLEGKPIHVRRGTPVYAFANDTRKLPGHSGSLTLNAERPTIRLSPGIDRSRARVAVAHELGHYLIHRRDDGLDTTTARLPSTSEEEALAEYAARLLLLPRDTLAKLPTAPDRASMCLQFAREFEVTLHTAAARLGDPDASAIEDLVGVIFWRVNPKIGRDKPIASRLMPQWHLSPNAFIPIHRCHAGRSSLVTELATAPESCLAGARVETVSIGSLKGSFKVEAVAWGSLARGSRLVLSIFSAT